MLSKSSPVAGVALHTSKPNTQPMDKPDATLKQGAHDSIA